MLFTLQLIPQGDISQFLAHMAMNDKDNTKYFVLRYTLFG